MLLSFQSYSQNVLNSDTVKVSKETAQKILRFADSADAIKIAYQNLQTNYNRLKKKSSIQDTAYRSKQKETMLCNELLKNQQAQTEMWSMKSHDQAKQVKKQKALKWLFIFLTSASVGWGLAK